MALLSENPVYLFKRLICQRRRISLCERHIHHGTAVFIVIRLPRDIDKLSGHIDIRAGPGHHIYAVHIFDHFFIELRLIGRDILDHNPGRSRITKLRLHHIDRFFGSHTVRQIRRQVIVDLNKRNTQNTDHRQHNKNSHNFVSVSDDPLWQRGFSLPQIFQALFPALKLLFYLFCRLFFRGSHFRFCQLHTFVITTFPQPVIPHPQAELFLQNLSGAFSFCGMSPVS